MEAVNLGIEGASNSMNETLADRKCQSYARQAVQNHERVSKTNARSQIEHGVLYCVLEVMSGKDQQPFTVSTALDSSTGVVTKLESLIVEWLGKGQVSV